MWLSHLKSFAHIHKIVLLCAGLCPKSLHCPFTVITIENVVAGIQLIAFPSCFLVTDVLHVYNISNFHLCAGNFIVLLKFEFIFSIIQNHLCIFSIAGTMLVPVYKTVDSHAVTW